MIEIEDKLKAEHQTQIDAREAEIKKLSNENADRKATIAKQLEQIQILSTMHRPVKSLNNRIANYTNAAITLRKRLLPIKPAPRLSKKILLRNAQRLLSLSNLTPRR
jgi:hypothetical protein